MTDYPGQPFTPGEVEARLRFVVTALDKAQRELAEARDTYSKARVQHDIAVARATVGKEAPHVARGTTTTAERDAWVRCRTEAEYRALRAAETRETIALDRLRTLTTIADVLRSLNRAAMNTFSLAGV